MATLAPGGRVTESVVAEELDRLTGAAPSPGTARAELVLQTLGAERAARLDRFDRVQLEDVLGVCQRARSCPQRVASCSPLRAPSAPA